MSNLKPPVGDSDHVLGNPTAPLELVEYGDYECPHCGRAYPIIKQMMEAMGDNLKFIFRNFPLAEAHPHSVQAAIAAEVADHHDKFWKMHDTLFENQFNLREKDLRKYAVKVGLDRNLFDLEIMETKYAEKVDADFETGMRSGVNGTPCFFINGRKFGGDWSAEPFLEHLKSVLAKG